MYRKCRCHIEEQDAEWVEHKFKTGYDFVVYNSRDLRYASDLLAKAGCDTLSDLKGICNLARKKGRAMLFSFSNGKYIMMTVSRKTALDFPSLHKPAPMKHDIGFYIERGYAIRTANDNESKALFEEALLRGYSVFRQGEKPFDYDALMLFSRVQRPFFDKYMVGTALGLRPFENIGFATAKQLRHGVVDYKR